MKKLVSIVALAVALSVSASAQSGIDFSKIGNVLTNMAGAIYSGPVTLDGSYTYNGVAVSATSNEGGILTNLAGTAVTSGIESKADEYLAKVGVKPGALTWTFNKADNSFSLQLGSLSIPGTYRVGDGERTVTLTFGKSFNFLNMTGTLESTSGGARMLFTADKAMAFIKKLASVAGKASSQVSSISRLADGYNNRFCHHCGARLLEDES